eukprot:TRINITY_DN14252_c0_g1_i2.p3 TRINITY_DN14252_c0_g1~~TRINITY_DN14252_c0_g1_i2.p3  ORF type:complete len:102 (-),score=10.05 TRINITY_DN14252_c0_g1_i2:372-677(-)
MLPMDSGDILLGRPWMYDKNGTHGMRSNMYTFMHDGKEVTLHKKKKTRITKEKIMGPCHKGSASRTPCLQRQREEDPSSMSNSTFNLGGNDAKRATMVLPS